MAGRVAYTGGIVRNGLVLHLDAAKRDSYPKTGTVWTDLSGNRNNGTLNGGAGFNSGNGGSITFDGLDEFIEFGDILDLGINNATINVWFNINSTWASGTKWLVTKTLAGGQAYRYGFGLTQTRQLRAIVDGDGLTPVIPNTNATLNLNQWYMGTLVIDRASSLQFYLNGVLQSFESSATISQWNGLNFQSNNPFRVGAYTDANNTSSILNFPGNIAITQMYFRALSAAEVLQNYNALKNRYI